MKYTKLSYTLIIAVLLVAFISINLAAARYHYRFDLTKARRFTLSEKTKEVIGQLEETIKITAFIAEGSSTGSEIKNLLKEYGFTSSKIIVSFSDPQKDPALANKYNVKEYNTIIVEDSKHSRTISQYNLYSPGANQYSMNFNGEQAVTGAILNLGEQTQAMIYFLAGHGEASLMSDLDRFNLFLMGEGYTTGQLDLPVEGKIPEDAGLIVAVGPQRDLIAKERDMLENFIKSGGKMLLFFGPTDPKIPLDGWKGLLAAMGLKMHDDIVTDSERSFYSDPLTPVPMVEKHQVTDILLEKKLSVIFPYTRSLEALEQIPEGLQVSSLLVTSPKAFGETNLEESEVSLDENDIPGPLHLAYAISKATEEAEETPLTPNTITAPDLEIGEPIAVVAGNMAFLGGQSIGLAGNLDFAASSINWLLQTSNLLNIPAKTQEPPFVNLTGNMANNIFYATVVILPLAVIIVGFALWWRRRNL